MIEDTPIGVKKVKIKFHKTEFFSNTTEFNLFIFFLISF